MLIILDLWYYLIQSIKHGRENKNHETQKSRIKKMCSILFV